MIRTLIISLLLIALISCRQDAEYPVEDDATFFTLKSSRIEFLESKNGNSGSDPFNIHRLDILDDSVFVMVSYSGGCRQHSFEIIWSEMFYETVPEGTGIIINHNANGDNCKALITETLSFNLKEFSEILSSGTICVNILNGWARSDSVTSCGCVP